MGWPDALIGAAAAISGGVIGALAGLSQTSRTLRSAKQLQDDQLAADQNEARVAREHLMRRDAYGDMMTYINWAVRVNAVRATVVDRRRVAVEKVKATNIQNITSKGVIAAQAAFDKSGPTKWEQGVIDGGPTVKERFRILGLVDTFASSDVMDKFHQAGNATDDIEDASVRFEKALMDFPDPLGSNASVSEISAAAIRQINSAGDSFFAAQDLLRATEQFDEVVKSVRDTARAELAQIKSEVEPSHS